MLEEDGFKDECGIFGVLGLENAAMFTALGLHALQHRGQEAAGIVSVNGGGNFHIKKVAGLVGDNFNSNSDIELLHGSMAIGHVRYSTTGGNDERNIQPIYAEIALGKLAIAHNGNLTNTNKLKARLINRGSIFHSTSDTEVIVHLISTSAKATFLDRLFEALGEVKGAYSMVMLHDGALYGMRDPNGVRPLVLGRLEGGAYVLTSETCALDIVGAELVRDIEPGEVVKIEKGEISSYKPFAASASRFCIFEYVYFARPDSNLEGRNVYEIRKRIGAELAKECPVEADIVVPVPDSGVPAALGFAESSGIPFELGITRNHYVGRTFIQPRSEIRHLGVKLKHNPSKQLLEGKRVVLIDDSIVRGTTSQKIVTMVRDAGALEVHMRISSPPTANCCYYGIDTPEKSQLLAANLDLAAMTKYINVDSLGFISIDGLYRATGLKGRTKAAPEFCDACFTGDYPIEIIDLQ